MKINIEEKFTITKISIKKETNQKILNLLAYASITLTGDAGSYFVMSGFTVWNSKFGGFNVEPPKNKNFEFHLFEKSFWKKLKNEIIKEYDYSTIPIIEDNRDGDYAIS